MSKPTAAIDATQNATVSPALSPRLLGVHAAARYLGVSPATIRDLVTAGRLPRVRLAIEVTLHRRSGELRRVLVDVRDLDALIARSKEGGQ